MEAFQKTINFSESYYIVRSTAVLVIVKLDGILKRSISEKSVTIRIRKSTAVTNRIDLTICQEQNQNI